MDDDDEGTGASADVEGTGASAAGAPKVGRGSADRGSA